MTLERWQDMRDVDSIWRDMDKLCGGFFPTHGKTVCSFPVAVRKTVPADETAEPAMDVLDRTEEVVVRVEMPGVEKKDIDISLHENILTVKGIVKGESEGTEDGYYVKERTHSTFARSVKVPVKVDTDKITAELKLGVLDIHLPKSEELKPRKIKIDSSN